jgi:DNA-binding IclR family transcriptional regulator
MMQFIYDNTHESVAVSSQNDIFIQHIRVMQPPTSEKIDIPEGSMRVLTHSCAGLALMSRMDPKMVDKLCRHINIYVQDKALAVDLATLEQQFNFIRSEGYSYLAAFPFPNASGVAMTLPETPHGIPLTIGVGGLNGNIARQRSHILATMRQAIQIYQRTLLANADARAEGYGEPAEDADHLQLH